MAVANSFGSDFSCKTVCQPAENYSVFNGNITNTNVCTQDCHWTLSWSKWFRYTSPLLPYKFKCLI